MRFRYKATAPLPSIITRSLVPCGTLVDQNVSRVRDASSERIGCSFPSGSALCTIISGAGMATLPRLAYSSVTVETLARAKGCTAAQLALAWLLSRGDDVIPIPGSTRIERVEENAAATLIQLSPEERAALDALAPMVAGERYAEGGMRAVNR